MSAGIAPPRPIDPFAGATGQAYVDDAVVVRRGLRPHPGEQLLARTGRFAVGRRGGRLVVLHDLPDALLDNDVAALISAELFDPGWVTGADTFERLMTGVVLSCRPDPLEAWELFYRNTLQRVEELIAVPETVAPVLAPAPAAHGCLAGFAPIYGRTEELIAEAGAGVVADLGSCFGFLPFRIAAQGSCDEVVASDLSAGTCRLVERMAAALRLPVRVITCDAANVPLTDRSADTVTVVHLLEHVHQGHGDRIVREALRLARHRVIIAVPLETEPDPAFGHVRTLSLDELADCARRLAPGWRAEVSEFHGGWLVLDR